MHEWRPQCASTHERYCFFDTLCVAWYSADWWARTVDIMLHNLQVIKVHKHRMQVLRSITRRTNGPMWITAMRILSMDTMVTLTATWRQLMEAMQARYSHSSELAQILYCHCLSDWATLQEEFDIFVSQFSGFPPNDGTTATNCPDIKIRKLPLILVPDRRHWVGKPVLSRTAALTKNQAYQIHPYELV